MSTEDKLRRALKLFTQHYPNGINPYLDEAYSLAREALAATQEQPGTDADYWEKAWARQIAEVVGNQNAVRIIELAKLNGLFDPLRAPPAHFDSEQALAEWEAKHGGGK